MGELNCLNVGCADTSVIISESAYFLIDCYNIQDHTAYLPINKKIREVFITHQHYDHFLGLKYLKDNDYSIEFLIYSPYVRRYNDSSVKYEEWQEFNSYVDYFKRKGTEMFTPYRQDSVEDTWWKTNGIEFRILGPVKHIATSSTREIHAQLGNRVCLFTGDSSDTSLSWIATNTTNYCNDILHASHHGSLNGADLEFIRGANAKYTIISTASGFHDSVPHPIALQRYRNHTQHNVYRTDINGTLTLNF
jgi:beta-lactamase superfamily II metal-dependent hydrolase